MSMKLDNYITEIKAMRRANVKGQLAPHKPILLLSVIELVRKGHCLVNRISPDSELSAEFRSQWEKYVPEDSPFRCTLAMPYYHMRSEPFWSLVVSKTYAEHQEYSTMDAIRDSFECAVIDDDLFFMIYNATTRDILEKEIISFFFPGHVDGNAAVESSSVYDDGFEDSTPVLELVSPAPVVEPSLWKTLPLAPQERKPATVYRHALLLDILKARGLSSIQNPIWKMKITDGEYDSLKRELAEAHLQGRLSQYGSEAAICYAEWWRREFAGGFPSKEAVANSIGIDDPDELYLAARKALLNHHFRIISVSQRREYFRTMLGQGGIPVNYVKAGSNFSNYSAFLRGLVHELSVINYDWNDADSSIVQNLNCISRLPRSFQNESIYDISLQIAHAIITDDDTLLPYDSDDRSLAELTKGLKREHERARTEQRVKPLSISWRLVGRNDSRSFDLWYSLDPVKEIGSESIPGLSPGDCFSFDVIMGGKVVAKYTRLKTETDDETGAVIRAIYSRINLGVGPSMLWKGEQMVEVKVRGDDGSRLFLVLPGSYPPDFSMPQTFQLVEGSVYARTSTANTENNIALFSQNWNHPSSSTVSLNGEKLGCLTYSDTVTLVDSETGETVTLKNDFTPYSVEYADTYVDWIEGANYKICTSVPRIRVFDGDKNPVSRVDTFYRMHGTRDWRRLLRGTVIPQGLVQFKVTFPDGHSDTESFYCIGGLGFSSSDSTVSSATISCHGSDLAIVEMESSASLTITPSGFSMWKVSRDEGDSFRTHTCAFRIYKFGMPVLRIEMPLPFVGITVIGPDGSVVSNRKVISYSNLLNYRIVCQGQTRPILSVSYDSGDDRFESQRIDCVIPEGITPLTDFSDAYDRMFNYYGPDSFSRKESVCLSMGDTTLFIRKFVLESEMSTNGVVTVIDRTEVEKSGRFLLPEQLDEEKPLYKGQLLAFPLSNSLPADEIEVYSLDRVSPDGNDFSFPDDFPCHRAIVFSDIADRRRIVPKLFYLSDVPDDPSVHLTLDARNSNREASFAAAMANLHEQDIFTGEEWKRAYRSFDTASRYGLPFKTFTTLWAIGTSAELTARFVLGMWYSGNGDVLVQDISAFEQEMVTAVHWIRPEVWQDVIGEYMNFVMTNMAPLAQIMIEKLKTGFMEYFRDVFNVTVGTESASEFFKMVAQGLSVVEKKPPFQYSEVQEINSKVVGACDDNKDLPNADIRVVGSYYPARDMKYYYRMMLNCPVCVAENLCSVDGCIDLWDSSSMEQRRVINFYRQYFKNNYSRILLRALGIIVNKR